MATSGSFTSKFASNMYNFILEWKRNSSDITNRKSNITVTLYIQSAGSSYTINSSAIKNGTLTIDGTLYDFTFYASLSGNQKKKIYTKTVDVYHDSDGSKSFTISSQIVLGITFSSGLVNAVNVTGTATLEDLPIASNFTLSTTNATLGSTNVTVNITRDSTSFTHKVYVKFGNNTTTIASSATTSASWTPPLSLASQIPNATKGTAIVYVDTYNGGTKIATSSRTLTYTIPESIVPVISSLDATVIATGTFDEKYGYVRGVTKCKLTINGASGIYSSTIKSYKITGNGINFTSSSGTTGILNTEGTFTYSATVTDSRGRTSDVEKVSITVYAYLKPRVNEIDAIRCTADGTPSDNGTYIKVSAIYSYNTLGGTNSATSSLEYKKVGTTNWIDAGSMRSESSVIIGGGNIVTNSAYDVRLTISDDFNTTAKIVNVAPEFVTIDFKSGGRGIALGKEATTDNLFEVNLPTQFNEKIALRKGCVINRATANYGIMGYLKIAKIVIKDTQANQIISFDILQRKRENVITLNVKFKSEAHADPSIESFNKLGECEAYIYKSGTGTWDVFVKKAEAYDDIEIVNYRLGEYMDSRISVTFVDEYYETPPKGGYEATYSYAHIDKTNLWDGRPVCIDSSGVAEVGKYLDFFNTEDATDGNSARFTCGATVLNLNTAFFPSENGKFNLGGTSSRWATIYAVNALNTSDVNYKENIIPISESNMRTMSLKNDSINEEITLNDMRNFIKDDCDLFKYNYKNQDHNEIGFIAQNIVDTKVGSILILGEENVDGGYYYSTGTYMGIIVGALKEEISLRDRQIEILEERISVLEDKLNK